MLKATGHIYLKTTKQAYSTAYEKNKPNPLRQIAPGSYGILHVRDSDDGASSNQFKVTGKYYFWKGEFACGCMAEQ
ncbi:immunity 7 family protein [Paenibacillus polysaccharolyticus]|uniref:Imm7 family immunity protein n=1 Tax=Paenibacillus polysaccharolyticus TaxID=582692 RepID=UPI0020A00315|nr:Imm7 family immunity protein [Paenibacillus polysaccharolyticus]MCP1136958.1 immunity 7 family protein [Paenibacillus polysaccharolyticus]